MAFGLGSAIVEVTHKGIEAVKAALSTVRVALSAAQSAVAPLNAALNSLGTAAKKVSDNWKEISATIGKVGSQATLAFGAASASIAGFLRIADPVGFSRLQGAMAALSVQIGSIFIPILDKLRANVEAVLKWFEGLTDAQKSQIVGWVETGLAVLGVVAAASKLISILTPIVSVLGALGSSVLLPLTAAVAAVAGAFYFLGRSTDETGEKLGIFARIWDGMKTAAMAVWDTLVAVYNAIDNLGNITNAAGQKVGLFATIWKYLVDAFEAVMAVVRGLWTVFQAVLTPVMSILQALWQVVSVVVGGIVSLFNYLYDLAKPLFQELGALWETLAESFSDEGGVMHAIVTGIGDVISWLLGICKNVFGGIIDLLGLLKPVFGAVFGFIKGTIDLVIKSIIYLATLLKEIAKGNFTGAVKAANDAVAAFEKKKEGGSSTSGGSKAKEDQRFAPLATQKSDLIGLSDIWKKVQTAQTETPEVRARREQLELQRRQVEQQEKTNELLEQQGNRKGGAILTH